MQSAVFGLEKPNTKNKIAKGVKHKSTLHS